MIRVNADYDGYIEMDVSDSKGGTIIRSKVQKLKKHKDQINDMLLGLNIKTVVDLVDTSGGSQEENLM